MKTSRTMSRHPSAPGGFTIVELMITVAIVSILAVIALPVYQDYVTRTQVAEGVGFVASAKTNISERYYTLKTFPTDNTTAGLSDPNSYREYDFIRRLEVGTIPQAGTIKVTFRLPGSASDNKSLIFIPGTQTRLVTWTCRPADTDGIRRNHAPPICR